MKKRKTVPLDREWRAQAWVAPKSKSTFNRWRDFDPWRAEALLPEPMTPREAKQQREELWRLVPRFPGKAVIKRLLDQLYREAWERRARRAGTKRSK